MLFKVKELPMRARLREMARATAHRLRPRRGLTRGSKIADMVALGKCITLCPMCRPKFNAKRNGYHNLPHVPRCRGECDGCGDKAGWCEAFVPINSTRI